jgi:Na+/proline symporter
VPDQGQVLGQFVHEFSTLAPQSSWLSYLGRILMTGLGALMGQDLIQRCLASKNESIARSSAITGGVCYLLLGLIPLFIGVAGRTILPNLETPELLIPILAKTYLSPLVFTLFSCGILAAIMSTADSYLLAGTSLITNNVLLKIWPLDSEQKKIRRLRWVNLFLAFFAFGLALSGPSIFDLMVHSGALLFVSIFVPATIALFSKQINTSAAWGALIGGALSWLVFVCCQLFRSSDSYEEILFSAAVFGAAMSFISYVVIAVLSRKPVAVQSFGNTAE